MLSTILLLSVSCALAEAPAAPELPEDLGPAVIDVSSYPEEHQKTYRDLFLPVYGFLRGGPARAINSPLVEIDEAGEEGLRRLQPELFADPALVQLTRDGWKREVFRVKNRPPCCGACPFLTQADARALRRFLVYDSIKRKTGPAAASWLAHRRRLVARFKTLKNGPAPAAAGSK